MNHNNDRRYIFLRSMNPWDYSTFWAYCESDNYVERCDRVDKTIDRLIDIMWDLRAENKDALFGSCWIELKAQDKEAIGLLWLEHRSREMPDPVIIRDGVIQ